MTYAIPVLTWSNSGHMDTRHPVTDQFNNNNHLDMAPVTEECEVTDKTDDSLNRNVPKSQTSDQNCDDYKINTGEDDNQDEVLMKLSLAQVTGVTKCTECLLQCAENGLVSPGFCRHTLVSLDRLTGQITSVNQADIQRKASLCHTESVMVSKPRSVFTAFHLRFFRSIFRQIICKCCAWETFVFLQVKYIFD